MILPDIFITQLCKTMMFLIVAQIVQLCVCGEIMFLVVSAARMMWNAQTTVSEKNIIILTCWEIKSRLSAKTFCKILSYETIVI